MGITVAAILITSIITYKVLLNVFFSKANSLSAKIQRPAKFDL